MTETPSGGNLLKLARERDTEWDKPLPPAGGLMPALSGPLKAGSSPRAPAQVPPAQVPEKWAQLRPVLAAHVGVPVARKQLLTLPGAPPSPPSLWITWIALFVCACHLSDTQP